MRTSFLSVLLMALVLFTAGPALAQTPAEVAEIVAVQGYYVEPGAEPVSEAELIELANTMQDRGYNFVAVVLAEDPSGGAPAFASAIVDQFSVGSTVVVLTPSELASDSTEFSNAELVRAGQDSLDVFNSDVNDGFTLFADNLTPGVAAGGGSGGGGFPWGLVFVVGGIVLFVFWVVRRQTKVEKQRKVEDISEAQAEIKHQLDEIANLILEETDAIRVAEHEKAAAYLQQASQTYADALDLYERTTKLSQLETISDALDKARWQLQAAVALRDGREIPPEPVKERATCFFDPAHPPAVETAVLKTSAGQREVKVCPTDAERLRRGQQPQPRQINVGGRPIPAPMAPKSYGGGGFGMMDIFEVILGGMAASGGFGGVGRPKPHARTHRRYTRNREIPVSRKPSRRGLIRKARGRRAGAASASRRGLRRR
ncbi:MAG: hypothetical protein HKO82_11395 [Acidimicrobiia bacterium]|nr:hypothetical protein [Acidimicrobiia bacterium]MBT8247625.1 hypothetical protein [Acidimicrobiia bacterium]NNJ48703.1 hypothetical protein [Acidimicrobiia bacterium]NNL14276.1 hypothetical protein [Acidimicrobiia bacterium]NNL70403.1 hypothetical protein [Acidimicrobiia bacterium]